MRKTIFALFVLINGLFASNIQVLVKEQSASHMVLQVKAEEPQWQQAQNGVYVQFDRGALVTDQAGNVVPVVVHLFNLPFNSSIPFQITSVKFKTRTIPNYRFVEEPGAGENNAQDWASVQYLGQMGQYPIFALRVFPVQVSADRRTVKVLQSMEIIVGKAQTENVAVFDGKSQTPKRYAFLSKVLLNKNSRLFAAKPQARSALKAQNTSALWKWKTVLQNEVVFKLVVDEEGLYRVGYQELLTTGFPLNQVDPRRLHLYNRGKEVPLYFKGERDGHFDENDYFEFWGERNEKTFRSKFPELYADPFSDENVYWLVYEPSPGRRLVEESGGINTSANELVISPLAFRDTLHFEENRVAHKFGHTASIVNRPAYEMDQFFFDGGISAPGGVGYDFELPDPAEFGAEVTVWAMFRGKSFFDQQNNPLKGHKVAVKLRGAGNVAYLVGQVDPSDGWRDQELRMITNADSAVKISQSALNNGTNRLEVDMFQTGVTDIVVLNWFEVSYLRQYRAHNNYLKFHVDRDFFDGRYIKLGDRIQFNIDGFTQKDVDVYKIGISKITNVDVKPVTDEKTGRFYYRISFQDEVVDPSTKYVALTTDQRKSVKRIEPFRPWKQDAPEQTLLEANNGASYLIITHDLFVDDCQRLKALKENDGLKSEVVTVRDIYDLFNYGIKSPLAIKAFIKYVYHNWDQTTPLQYVLLVGDANQNYRSADDLVPTIFFNTVKFGAAESDFEYSLLEGNDFVPEISVARIPARTVYELKNYIDKIENFPGEPLGEWTNRTLFIAGYDGMTEYLTNKPVFRAQNLRLINHRLPQALFAEQINSIENKRIQPDPHFGSSFDVINAFDRGLAFINFVGHGGGAIWADAGLMGLEEVERLNNGYKLPFVASMTCFTASFANSERYSLGEKMIVSEQKGAIAFLGSAGVGWVYNDYNLEWGLFDYLWDANITFGQAVTLMKIFYLANPFYNTEAGRFYTFGYGSINRSQVAQYNFFGDPALHIPYPQKELRIYSERQAYFPGDSVKINISGLNGTVNFTVQVTDQGNYIVDETSGQTSNGSFKFVFQIPENLPPQILRVKAFASNEQTSANGILKISVDQPLVKRIVTLPEKPQIFQPVIFKVILDTREPIETVTLQNFHEEKDYKNYNVVLQTTQINDSTFQTLTPFSDFGQGGKKFFDVKVLTKSGKEIIQSWNFIEVVDPRPDVMVVPGSVSFEGDKRLKLRFELKNNSTQNLENVKVACFDEAIVKDQPFATISVNLNAQKAANFSVTLPDTLTYSAYHQVRVIADYDSLLDEKNELNNMVQVTLYFNYFWATPSAGSSFDRETNQSIQLSPSWSFNILPNTLTESTLVKFSNMDIAPLIRAAKQYDLKYLPIDVPGDSLGVQLQFLNPNVEGKVNGVLQAVIDSTQVDHARTHVYRYEAKRGIWSVVPTQWQGNRLNATVDRSGIYALFYSNDTKEPLLEISVNGRPLISGMLVPQNPTIGVLLQDVNGVELGKTIDLQLDGTYLIKDGVVLDETLVLPDSGVNVKNVQLVLTPELAPGKHTLLLKAADVNGNIAQKELTFSVAEGFNIIVYGNYPNPFKDRTIISYFIESNEEIDDLSIKIYSTSGRLVRSRMLDLDPTVLDDNLREPNYHELVWDGTDDDGNPVANGVYFLVFKGKYRGKTVKRTLKIARLQ